MDPKSSFISIILTSETISIIRTFNDRENPPISHLQEENTAFSGELRAQDLVKVVHQDVSVLRSHAAKLGQ
jgi:hypothetical protein